MNTTALRWLALAALVFPGVTAFAQKKPKENAEVLVSVKWAEYDVPTSATYSFSFEDTGSSGPAMISESGNGSGNGVYTSTAASAGEATCSRR